MQVTSAQPQPTNLAVGATNLDIGAIPDSLVPFDTFRISGATLVFRNERLGAPLSGAEMLDRYAFAVRSRDMAGRLESRRKVFHADRYGGAGLLRNGGSGRCGYDGAFQIKGIGQTPLAGRKVAAMYSDGMLPLIDAVVEAAWGEITHCILPHGGVRAVGVLSTGTRYKSRRGESVARGLLIRDGALRPAHFERAIYFRPSRRFLAGAHPHDVQRTADALSRLPSILRHGLLADCDLVDPGEILVNGLTAFVERVATQVAAAQAKRVMHGALGSSNLALDGRWLDFGCITSLPLAGFGDDFDYPPLWHEPDGVMHGVKELIFYAEKYVPEFRPISSYALSAVSCAYISRLSTETRFRLLLLTGLPQAILRLLPADEEHANTLAGMISAMLHAGFKPPGCISEPVSDSRVGAVCLILARYHQDPSCESRLVPYVMGKIAPDMLLKAYRGFMEQASGIAGHHGLSPTHLETAIRINALRFSKYPDFMYRPKLLQQIESIIGASTCPESLHASITQLLDTIHCLSKALLADSDGLEAVLWSDDTESLRFDPARGEWQLAGASTETRFRTRDIASRLENSHVGRQLRSHFGPGFLEFS